MLEKLLFGVSRRLHALFGLEELGVVRGTGPVHSDLVLKLELVVTGHRFRGRRPVDHRVVRNVLFGSGERHLL